MPVKVRCPECEKVLTLPDQARGKTAKCPECQARVPVPGAKKKPAPAAAKSASRKTPSDEGGDELIANLDLSRAEDQKSRVCPKCGVPVDEEDIECPKCFVTLSTGRLSAERQRKKERGGPDPDKYYEKFLTTGWEFLKEHWMFGVRTMLYLMIALTICLFALFMTVYTSKVPLKVFWFGIAFLFAMMAPGWCMFLNSTLINSAIDKKVRLDRVRFDFFTCAALGIKFYCWLIVFCAPFQVVFGTVGGLMISNDMLAGGLAVIAIGFLPGFFCFPVAMAHLAMPVQWPGWLSPKILPQYFQGLVKPSMYWCMFCAAMMLPSLIFVLVAVLVYQEDMTKLLDDLNHNARVENVLAHEEPKQKSKGIEDESTALQGQVDTELNAVSWWFFASKDQIDKELKYYTDEAGPAALPGADGEQRPSWEREVDMEVAMVPTILLLLGIAPFAFAAVFSMRTNALLTYYFRPELQLVAEEKEVKWESKKKQELDDDGNPMESSDVGKYAMGIGGTILFYVIVNVIMYFATDGEYLLLPRPIAKAMNLMDGE